MTYIKDTSMETNREDRNGVIEEEGKINKVSSLLVVIRESHGLRSLSNLILLA